MSEIATLTPKQRTALAELAMGRTALQAAEAAGVARQTVYRWQSKPAFAAALRTLDGEVLRQLGRRILAMADQTAQAIEDALNVSQPITVRLRAAVIVAERGPALAELNSVIQRLEELERSHATQTS